MIERLNKVRKENPSFDRELVDSFAKSMPKLLMILIDGSLYEKHIGSKETAKLAEQFITNSKNEHIGFKWDYDTVINIVKSYIDLQNAEFYPCDIWVWANVKYGDMSHIINDTDLIIRYAISELKDDDYPYCPASQRAYHWLKKHIEKQEQ